VVACAGEIGIHSPALQAATSVVGCAGEIGIHSTGDRVQPIGPDPFIPYSSLSARVILLDPGTYRFFYSQAATLLAEA
jgi:hypothetical protein